MRSMHRSGPLQVPAALAVTACLMVAACGGVGANQHQSAKSASPSATASAEPTSGPAAIAAITANWKTVFNGKVSIPTRLALVQDGSAIAAFVRAEAKTAFGAAATGSTATVRSVTITSPSQARVDYDVLLLGTPLLKNQVGTAVYRNGVWQVGIASFCALAIQAVSSAGPKAPAVCRG